MRSVMLVGLVLLAGCEDKAGTPYSHRSGDAASPSVAPPIKVPGPPAISSAVSTNVNSSKPPVPPPPRGAPAFQALGTEPFWSVEVADGNMRYTTPEDQKGQREVSVEASLGKGWRFAAVLNGKPAVLVIQPGQCSDGMSDTVYPYTAAFTLGGTTEQGCAKLK